MTAVLCGRAVLCFFWFTWYYLFLRSTYEQSFGEVAKMRKCLGFRGDIFLLQYFFISSVTSCFSIRLFGSTVAHLISVTHKSVGLASRTSNERLKKDV